MGKGRSSSGGGPERGFGPRKKGRFKGKVPFSSGMRQLTHDIRNNLSFSKQKPPLQQHEAHQGKPVRKKRSLKKESFALMAHRHGAEYEELAARILADFHRTPKNNMGVDFVSRDGQHFVEVKGTLNGANMGTFSNIKVLNRALMNNVATEFLFITPTHVYLCPADKLREFVQKNYSKLSPKEVRGDARLRATLTIKDLVAAGLMVNRHGDLQAWVINHEQMDRIALGKKMDPKKPVLLQPFASRMVYSRKVLEASRAKMAIEEADVDPSFEPMGRRFKRRGGGGTKNGFNS
ncbi:MAG: hypothetical protein J4215_03280 [Candidatus Diapherotrites archaeon]|uniref:Uncharacterized protein n=1 Tax=Candidatus Iainarchaeum sp. TaxID=3101447 RepID=A0A8T4L7T5_9ARCH|nr:hypothetical protein [Candidatus Diapherotrites archaeon]